MAGKIDPRDVRHIFRPAAGHIADTAANRRLLEETVEDHYFLGNDRFGNSWYARLLADGRQVWVQARGFRIRNGGINDVPRSFDPLTGLSRSEK